MILLLILFRDYSIFSEIFTLTGRIKMNRICISMDYSGNLVGIASDEPIRVFMIADHCPPDRVFEFTPGEGKL